MDLFHVEFDATDKCLNTVFYSKDGLAQLLTGSFASMPDLRFDVVSSFKTPDGRFAVFNRDATGESAGKAFIKRPQERTIDATNRSASRRRRPS